MSDLNLITVVERQLSGGVVFDNAESAFDPSGSMGSRIIALK